MRIAGKVVVVTGGGSGIGRALCERLAQASACFIGVVDRDIESARGVARAVGGVAFAADVADEAELRAVLRSIQTQQGTIDLYCSNAGVLRFDPDPANAASAPQADWLSAWGVNVMAHVYAARELLPAMLARGSGHFLITASAAGLLSAIGSATYSTTKHAAVGFAESLAITHHADGIRVTLLCPQAVDTPMLRVQGADVAALDGVMAPERLAEFALEAVAQERFIALPHPEVLTYMGRKVADYDRWITGMARLRGGRPKTSP